MSDRLNRWPFLLGKPLILRFIDFRFAVLTLLGTLCIQLPLQADTRLSLEPEKACAALQDVRLNAGQYQLVSGDRYQCRSLKRRLPFGEPLQNEARYSAYGNADRVQRVELYVDVLGRREVQPTLRHMLKYCRSLVHSLLGQALDDKIATTVLAAGSGRWQIGAAQLTLRRNSATGDSGYRYTLTLE